MQANKNSSRARASRTNRIVARIAVRRVKRSAVVQAAVAAAVVATAAALVPAAALDMEAAKCIPLPAASAAKQRKFRSNRAATNRYTAATVLQSNVQRIAERASQ